MIDVTPILDIVMCMKLLFYPQQKLRVKNIEIESLTMPRSVRKCSVVKAGEGGLMFGGVQV